MADKNHLPLLEFIQEKADAQSQHQTSHLAYDQIDRQLVRNVVFGVFIFFILLIENDCAELQRRDHCHHYAQ